MTDLVTSPLTTATAHCQYSVRYISYHYCTTLLYDRVAAQPSFTRFIQRTAHTLPLLLWFTSPLISFSSHLFSFSFLLSLHFRLSCRLVTCGRGVVFPSLVLIHLVSALFIVVLFVVRSFARMSQ